MVYHWVNELDRQLVFEMKQECSVFQKTEREVTQIVVPSTPW